MNKRAIPAKHYLFRDINAVIRLLIISDAVIIGSAGLLGPIFALFIEKFIEGGNEAVAGIAAAIYLVAKSLVQIPAAVIIDRIRGEKDDFYFMFVFSLIIALLPLLYLVINTPGQLYLVQFVLGVFTAFTFPSFMAIFTRHVDKAKEGTEWSVYFTLVDLSSAVFAAIGGYVAASSGYPILIFTVVILAVLGSVILWPIRSYLKIKST